MSIGHGIDQAVTGAIVGGVKKGAKATADFVTRSAKRDLGGGGGMPKQDPPKLTGGNVLAKQRFLQRQGYQVPLSGVMDAQTKSALGDWHSGAKTRDPGIWNTSRVRSAAIKQDKVEFPNSTPALDAAKNPSGKPNPPATNSSGTKSPDITGHGPKAHNPDPSGGNGNGGNQQVDNPLAQLMSQLGIAAKAPAGGLVNPALANRGAHLLNPDQYAEHQAALGYDSGISDAQHTVDQTQAQGAQNQQDIASWMKQVEGAQGVAAGRDKAASAAGQHSVAAAGAAILAALGGSANQGSSEVAGAVQNGNNELAALGANQDQYNADMAPLLKSQQADMAAHEQAQNSEDVSNARQKLVDLTTQRGAAKATAADQAQQLNNAIRDNQVKTLLGIKGQNSALRQQSFQDQLALAQTRAGLLMNGVKIMATMAHPNGGHGPKPFAQAPSSTHTDAFNQGVAALTGSKKTPQQAVQTVRNLLNGYGWSFRNPAVQQMAGNIVRSAGYGGIDPRAWAPISPTG